MKNNSSFKRFILVLVVLLSFCLLHSKKPEKYYLSVGAIFRNESRFLKEWIEYHRLVGVEHFYLFNHLSEDDYLSVLQPYIDNGVVELFDWPIQIKGHNDWVHVQCAAYNQLVKWKGKETFWLAIIDTDEFIIPVETDSLPSTLSAYEEFAGLGVNWQLYGTSGISRIPERKTLLGTLVRKASQDYARNLFVKTIFQPKRVKRVKKPHHCKYKKGWFHVTEEKIAFDVNKSLSRTVSVNKIRINHYTNRDEEFFYQEKVQRFLNWFPYAVPPQLDPELNKIEDRIAERYVPFLEKALFEPSP